MEEFHEQNATNVKSKTIKNISNVIHKRTL